MAVRYVRYGAVRVSRRWRSVLLAADAAGVGFHVNSGHRTMREQRALFAQNMQLVGGHWVPKPNHPLTAFPSPVAPHIRTGRAAHAIDVNSLDGGEARLQEWLEQQGAHPSNPVRGESWHMELGGRELARLARRFSPRLVRHTLVARRFKVRRAYTTLREAKAAGIPPALALAMVEQESGDGSNVFGHDPTIFAGAGKVTRAKYLEYRAKRRASGNRDMQGVGPLQLTWWQTQDRADTLGGCWRARINLRTGFRLLAANIKAHGERDGIRRYNGSGAGAERYATAVLAKRDKWRERLRSAG